MTGGGHKLGNRTEVHGDSFGDRGYAWTPLGVPRLAYAENRSKTSPQRGHRITLP